MSFKRPNRPKNHSRPAPTPLSKPKSKTTAKLHNEKFRAALDGSFDSLREASAVRKMNPVVTGAKQPQRVQRLPLVRKADIDASIDKLASLMK